MSRTEIDSAHAGSVPVMDMNHTTSTDSAQDVIIDASIDAEILQSVGQTIIVVFDGYTVTPEIKTMIEKYRVGNILLTAKNIKDYMQVSSLCHELQKIAHSAGLKAPLLVGIEQENGMLSRFGGPIGGTHFPGAMALGATRQPNKAFEIGKATASELAEMGINWNFAPVLEVMNENSNSAISVRAFGDDPQVVATFGAAFADGLRAGGVIHCAKHFPSIACSADWRRNPRLDSKAAGDLGPEELLPFRQAVAEGGLDSVMLSSSIWPVENVTGDDALPTRAKHIIGDVLRRQLGYEGVTVCDVTDMPLCANDVDKIGEALISAVNAGCDMMLIYQDPIVQQHGVEALHDALRTGRISRDAILRSSSTISRLKDHYIPWKTFKLIPPSPQKILSIVEQNKTIAWRAYENSITVVRDERSRIPLSRLIPEKGEVLLLTPVVRPLHKEEATMDPFECFGKAMAKYHKRIVHAAYRSQGLTSTHVELIKRCSAIVFVTVNSTRPSGLWQIELASSALQVSYGRPLVNVAACDPYDLLEDQRFSTYICTYEYSPMALEAAARVIFGGRHASGSLPVRIPNAPPAKQNPQWFVDTWEKRKDLYPSADLWQECMGHRWPLDVSALSGLLDRPHNVAQHFVVRHPESQELLGLAATFTIPLHNHKVIGSLAVLLVRPSYRHLGIGRRLHDVAHEHLRNTPEITSMQLGSIFPRFFPGLPVDIPDEDIQWFARRGWKLDDTFVYDMFMHIENFKVTDNLSAELAERGITINNCRPDQYEALMEFENRHFMTYPGWTEKYAGLQATNDIADALIAYNQEEILGAVLIFSPVGNNPIARDIPWARAIGDRAGGLGFVSVKPELRGHGIRKGLIVAGILELKVRGLTGCFVDWADDITTYKNMGFQEWGQYREVWRKPEI